MEIEGCPRVIMTVGLLLNALGAGLVVFFGFPQPSFQRGIGLAIDGPQVQEHDRAVTKKEHLYKVLSRFALVLMIIGFLLQILATWL